MIQAQETIPPAGGECKDKDSQDQGHPDPWQGHKEEDHEGEQETSQPEAGEFLPILPHYGGRRGLAVTPLSALVNRYLYLCSSCLLFCDPEQSLVEHD